MLTIAPLQAQFADFTEMGLEDLSLVQLTGLGRKQLAIFESPAAASVVSHHQLRHSGALTIAEALRDVPGLLVERVDPLNYVVSARGLADSFANKLLFNIDGRPLYSATFSGAMWNYPDMIFEDVQRIEVLRGPGAALWGANAVNGVINIVSRSSFDTLGTYSSVAAGDHLEGALALRHGVQLSPRSAARVYAKYQEHDGYDTPPGPSSEGWNNWVVGARYDWRVSSHRSFSITAETRQSRSEGFVYGAVFAPPLNYVAIPDNAFARGTQVTARWISPILEEGELNIVTSYEDFAAANAVYGERRSTANLDLQVTLPRYASHQVLAGITFRSDHDHLDESAYLTFENTIGTTEFLGAFIQDEWTSPGDRISVTAGTKIERNNYSGWELQPSLRALWRPDAHHRVWAAVSRAARVPSRAERGQDYYIYALSPTAETPLPGAVHVVGSDEFTTESLLATELGYRWSPGPRFSADLALYANDYHDLRGWRFDPVIGFRYVPVFHYRLNYIATNNIEGRTYGGELGAQWKPIPTLTLGGSIDVMTMELDEISPSVAPDGALDSLRNVTPNYVLKAHIEWQPSDHWSFRLAARQVPDRPGTYPIDGYVSTDARVAWTPSPAWEYALVAHDPFESRHVESPSVSLFSEVSRSFLLRASFRH